MVHDGIGYSDLVAAPSCYLVQSKAAISAFMLINCSSRGRCDYRNGILGHAGDKR
jgi:hypothetical protein